MRVVHLGFAPDTVDYVEAWDTQREVHGQVVEGTLPDTTLLLEHTAVYTAGKRTEDHERPTDGTPVVDVDRGGKITWHGPGQLVGYPILRLPEVPIDVVAHVRRLEEVMIRVCREFGVETVRVDGRSGVWVTKDWRGPDRKLGAIGVRVSRRGEDGQTQTLRTIESGGYFGEMALLSNRPRSATVAAAEEGEVECLVLHRLDFLEEVRRRPEMAIRLLETLSRRLEDAERR